MEGLIKILSSDHLSVPKEDMVFDAAMLWLDKYPTTRKQGFDKVLEHVRLPLISPSYLQHVVESLDVVREQQACQSFISEAKGERPFSDTARPRRTTVIVTMGGESRRNKYGIIFPVNSSTETWRDTDLMSFDPLANQWRFLGHLPLEIQGHAVAMAGSILYLAGGRVSYDHYGRSIIQRTCGEHRDGDVLKKMWCYDLQANMWVEMANMNKERCYFSMVELDGQVFAVGGQGSEESPDSMERYNRTTNTWQLMESVGVAAYSDSYSGPAVVALDGHLYFIGGAPSFWNPNRPGVAKYNPATSVWTDVCPMQIPRDVPAVCTLNGKIYVIGGRHYDTKNGGKLSPYVITENTVERFDPETDKWTACAPMKDTRYLPSVVVADGKIYVLGGRGDDDEYPLDMERYSEETDTWDTVGEMNYSRYRLNCVSLRLRKKHKYMDDNDDDDDHYYGRDEDNVVCNVVWNNTAGDGFFGPGGMPYYEMDRYY